MRMENKIRLSMNLKLKLFYEFIAKMSEFHGIHQREMHADKIKIEVDRR